MNIYNGLKGKQKIQGDNFIIAPDTPIGDELYSKKDQVIEYSNKDNKIIEILSITQNEITTKYYTSWYPLVITTPCKMFYDESICKIVAERYVQLLNDTDKIQKLYSEICEEYNMFTTETGLYFNDRAGNNILLNSDMTDFRIIDICSIDVNQHTPLSNNTCKHILGYYSWKYVYDKYLNKTEVDNLLNKINQ